MSGFSADWLALREPVDHASVNHRVRTALVEHFAGTNSITLVDLGSGTGSNFRSIAPDLKQSQSWTLVDIDAVLLDVAARNCAVVAAACRFPVSLEYQVADLSTLPFDDLFAQADLVTASALFDLVSVSAIERIVESVSARAAAFYTTLTYDGVAAWLPEHPMNPAMRDAFNSHQKTDKGFGPAAGPDATKVIAAAFEDRGYTVLLGASPWILNQSQADLRIQTNRGWAAAVKETGQLREDDINDWLNARETAPNSVGIIGHTDLLAIPPGTRQQ